MKRSSLHVVFLITLSAAQTAQTEADNDYPAADHFIAKKFVFQKGYRMNHCQVTLNTDHTPIQRTASESPVKN